MLVKIEISGSKIDFDCRTMLCTTNDGSGDKVQDFKLEHIITVVTHLVKNLKK